VPSDYSILIIERGKFVLRRITIILFKGIVHPKMSILSSFTHF